MRLRASHAHRARILATKMNADSFVLMKMTKRLHAIRNDSEARQAEGRQLLRHSSAWFVLVEQVAYFLIDRGVFYHGGNKRSISRGFVSNALRSRQSHDLSSLGGYSKLFVRHMDFVMDFSELKSPHLCPDSLLGSGKPARKLRLGLSASISGLYPTDTPLGNVI